MPKCREDRQTVHGTRGQWSQTDGAAVARGRGGRRGGVRLFGTPHALRPECTAPTTAAEEGGVALHLAEAWHMVLAAPAHGRALGHQQRCGTSPNPKSSAPTTAEVRRRRGRGGRRCSTKTPRPVTCSARDLIKTLGFAPTPHDNNDGPDPEPRSTNAAACTARSCGAAQAYSGDSQTSTSCCFSKPRRTPRFLRRQCCCLHMNSAIGESPQGTPSRATAVTQHQLHPLRALHHPVQTPMHKRKRSVH